MKSSIAVKDAEGIEIKKLVMSKSFGLIFPQQMDLNHPMLKKPIHIYIVEEILFFKQFKFHKSKLLYHRATMKYFEDQLIHRGCRVQYVNSYQDEADIRKLLPILIDEGYDECHFIEPSDFWLKKRVESFVGKIKTFLYPSSLFINSKKDLEVFFKSDKKKFFQTSFYKQQRKKYKILIDSNGKPAGGKWTYDTENRKKYPKNKKAPQIDFAQKCSFYKEAKEYIEEYFSGNYGNLNDSYLFPISFKQSKVWLQKFLSQRFAEFGPYEDAIVSDETFLNHSMLTPMLNIGLINPKQIINEALIKANKDNVPIGSLEGFIRQIIGWREFMRGIYVVKGNYQRTLNFWQFKRKIPKAFYVGKTGIPPVDDTIAKVLNTGYCHHIERLMILGNFMLLCEFDPDEVYKWFMELFIDAYDWVMVPNVYGMSQFADGGLLSTKPYISSSNYILKMSNYSKGTWQQIWDGLFWRFMNKQREFFLKNPRLSMLIRTYDKMDEEKKLNHLKNAEAFLQNLN